MGDAFPGLLPTAQRDTRNASYGAMVQNIPGQKIIISPEQSCGESPQTRLHRGAGWGMDYTTWHQEKYYSIGAVVYSGTDLTYSGTFQFETQ